MDTDAYVHRANVWVQKRDYGKAIADSDQAIRLKPDFADGYITRGNALQGKNEYDSYPDNVGHW